jgi:hypothetical protein
VPTVDLASRYEVGAAVLHSPLTSGMRVAFPDTKRTWFFDAFPRYDHDMCMLFINFLQQEKYTIHELEHLICYFLENMYTEIHI